MSDRVELLSSARAIRFAELIDTSPISSITRMIARGKYVDDMQGLRYRLSEGRPVMDLG